MLSHTALSWISARAVSEDNAEKSLQLLVEMQWKGLVLDVIIYGSLTNARAKGYIAEKALQLLVEMQRKGLEPDVITFNALIHQCLRSERGEC